MSHATAAAFVAYFIVIAGIGYASLKRTRGLDDYAIGGRSLSAPVAALSAGASDMSGWLLLGLPGAVFALGLAQSWIVIGLVAGAWCNWRWVAPTAATGQRSPRRRPLPAAALCATHGRRPTRPECGDDVHRARFLHAVHGCRLRRRRQAVREYARDRLRDRSVARRRRDHALYGRGRLPGGLLDGLLSGAPHDGRPDGRRRPRVRRVCPDGAPDIAMGVHGARSEPCPLAAWGPRLFWGSHTCWCASWRSSRWRRYRGRGASAWRGWSYRVPAHSRSVRWERPISPQRADRSRMRRRYSSHSARRCSIRPSPALRSPRSSPPS